jgi:hypothetical protein
MERDAAVEAQVFPAHRGVYSALVPTGDTLRGADAEADAAMRPLPRPRVIETDEGARWNST